MIELTTDINLLMKYLQLQNTETLMAETYFGPYNLNQIFSRHAVFTESERTITTFVLHQFQTKLMT